MILGYDLTNGTELGYIDDISKNGYHATPNGLPLDEFLGGRGFTQNDRIYLEDKLTEQPMTYEAMILAPKDIARTGVIFGNYQASGNTINFEIHNNGIPTLYFFDHTRTIQDIKFKNCDLRTGTWTHLVITQQIKANSATFKCYINGTLAETVTVSATCLTDMATAQASVPFSLGRDSRDGNGTYFKGKMKGVALYNRALTESEIKASYQNGVNTSLGGIMAYYDLTADENTGSNVKNSVGNGEKYNLSDPFYKRTEALANDFAYSFAIVGDTQMLTLYDSKNGTKYTGSIYEWILNNQTSKNIQLVMGVGDITDNRSEGEWAAAQEAVSKLNGKIPYTLIHGNHEPVSQLDQYFGPDSGYNQNFAAFESTNSIVYMDSATKSLGNYYVKIEIGGNKYAIFGLEYGVPDTVIEWAGAELEKLNAEGYKAIITTHGYSYRNGTTLSSGDIANPSPNSGINVWNKLISKHENIVLTLSGHDPSNDVVLRQEKGIHGNVVNQLLVDFQYMDRGFLHQTGMVAMLYFSKDGSEVKVEFISGYQSANEGCDVLYGKNNQFTFNMNEIEGESTEYGIIPEHYTSRALYPIQVFGTDKHWVGAYSNWKIAISDIISEKFNRDYVILLRRDITDFDNPSIGNYGGNMTIDLGGFTASFGDYALDFYVDNNANNGLTNGFDVRGSFTVKNGTMKRISGTFPLVCINYGEATTNNVYCDFTFEGVEFISTSGTRFIFDTWENGYNKATATVTTDVTFADCTFNVKDSVSGTIFLGLNHSSNDNDRAIFNVDVFGGSILANTAMTIYDITTMNGDVNGRADTLELYKNSKSKYIGLVIPEGASKPTADVVWIGEGGTELVMIKGSTKNGYTTYNLVSKSIITYAPKTSVTLYTDFGYNIYLPKSAALTAVKLGDTSLDLGDLDIVKLDGEDYYKLPRTSLKSYEALEDVVLTVTLTDGADSYKGRFNLGLYSYANTVISGANTSETALAKDMLSYAKAAYTYWGKTSDKLASVDALLGADYNNTADMSKADTATAPENTGFTGVTLHLGDAPSYRFYYTTATAPTYTFKVGERKVNATEGTDENGKTYLEVKVYAYEMLLDVTFGTHTYSAYSYYAYAKTNNMTREMALVERLINYCESAEAYRKA